MRSNVPWCATFREIIKRLEGAEDAEKEGKQLCIDIINEVKEIEGRIGKFTSWPNRRRIVAESCTIPGSLKGPQPWRKGTQFLSTNGSGSAWRKSSKSKAYAA